MHGFYGLLRNLHPSYAQQSLLFAFYDEETRKLENLIQILQLRRVLFGNLSRAFVLKNEVTMAGGGNLNKLKKEGGKLAEG